MKLGEFFKKKPSASPVEAGMEQSPQPKPAVMNPVSPDVHREGERLAFQCPTCANTLTVNLETINPVSGVFADCPVCKNISHVPGGFRTQPIPQDSKITGGVYVPIGEFTDWFAAHPVVVTLKKNRQRELLYQYGLWAFCPKCGYRYSPTVLAYSLPFLKISQGSAGSLLNASSSGSGKEAKALLAGYCPSCRHKTLTVIIAEIPDAVRAVLNENR